MEEANEPGLENRRPIASRELGVMRRTAAWLTRLGVTPNAISVSSMVFASLAAVCFVLTLKLDGVGQRLCFFGAALCIQGRLLANLFDGMVAVEGGKATPNGDLYNEAPDRFSDVVILVAAGFTASAHWPDPALQHVAYLAAIAALLTAYIRALGASFGVGQVFLGPMSKQHRMFLVTLAALAMAVLPAAWRHVNLAGIETNLLFPALAIIALLGLVTALRRTVRINRLLNEANEGRSGAS